MADSMDFFNVYIMGSVQMLFGFYFFARLLNRKVRFFIYLLFGGCSIVVMYFAPTGRIAELAAYVLLLAAAGYLIFHADWKELFLYAALVVEVMQLSFGIVNSLLGVLYPLMFSFDRKAVGIVFMLAGDMVSLLLAGFCCHMVCRCFSYYEAVKKQYVFLVLIPVSMIFFMGEYINAILYGVNITDGSRITVYTNHYQILAIQLLGMASLFCILFAYKKLLQNFRLSTELSLLKQEEHSLLRYVEEAKTYYEKTKSFRHDIKNHIMVVKELLQGGKTEQALCYMGDMEHMAERIRRKSVSWRENWHR